MTMKSINPFTEEIMMEFETLALEEAISESKKARKAFHEWKKVSVSERARLIGKVGVILRREKEKLAEIITKEMGKPIKDSIAEVEKCAVLCDYYSENAEKFLDEEYIVTEAKKSYVRFDPLGVILG